MKIYLILLLNVFLSVPLQGAFYYVSTTGDDAHPGTELEPWRSIQKAADVMVAGDTCYIRGGVYRETVRPVNSGGAGSLITYAAYSNEIVEINGCDEVTGQWTLDAGSVYKTAVTMSLGHENQVFVNGKNMVWEARWPDVGTTSLEGLLEFPMGTMQTGTTDTTIFDSSIPDYDWTGGSAWVSSHKRWFSWTGVITGHGTGQINMVDNADPGGNMVSKADGKYCLFGVRDALDSENEWYYDAAQEELYIWAPGGGVPADVEIKSRVNGFDLSERDHIRLEGLNFFATSIQTSSTSDNLEFDRLNLQHVYHSNKAEDRYGSQSSTGLVLDGRDHVLTNSEIAYSSGTGVYLGGSGHWIVNNYIHDHDYIGSYASPLVLRGSDFVVSHNTIRRAGRQVVQFGDIYGSLFQYNNVSYAGYLTLDLGLVYGNSIAGGNAEVRYNWFHNNLSPRHGNGIYYDHGCKNIITHHNVVWDVTGKAISHNQYANYLLYYNNTGSTSDDVAIGSSWNAAQERDMHGCRYLNNVFTGQSTFNGTGYTYENNFNNYTELSQYRYLAEGTAPVDAAISLEGINNNWEGSGPDAGAYEIGGDDWIPGHDFDSAPVLINTTRSLPQHRNLLVNGSFEAGTLVPWTSMGSTTSLESSNNRSQWTGDGTTLVGSYSAKLGSGKTGVSQIIVNLAPETAYEFMGKFRVEPGESAFIGVRNHGGDEVTGSPVTDTISGAVPIRSSGTPYEWVQTTLKFTTGPDASSAEVYAWKNSDGSGTVYFEDAGVHLLGDGFTPVPYMLFEDFENGIGAWSVVEDANATASLGNVYQAPERGNLTGVQGLKIVDNSTVIKPSISTPLHIESNDVLYIQYDFRYTGAIANPMLILKSASTSWPPYINLYVNSSGNVINRSSTGAESLDTILLADKWYRFTLSIEPEVTGTHGSYGLRVQSLEDASLDDFYNSLLFQDPVSESRSYDQLSFTYNIQESVIGGEYHLDNISVTTEEEDLDYSIVEAGSYWMDSPVYGDGWRFSGEGYPGQAGIGWIWDVTWPWMYALGFPDDSSSGNWTYVVTDGGSRDAFYAWVAGQYGGNGYWVYVLSASGWYYSYENGAEGWIPFVW